MSPWLQYTLTITSMLASFFWMFQLFFAYLAYRREQEEYLPGGTPAISVVIPAFNESQKSVNDTVQSILNQQKVHVEIIVVDDGSKVPIQEVNGIKLVRLAKNQGKRHAQMSGVRIAEHQWIATIDSDTVLEPLSLWHLYKSAEKQNAQACTGSVFLSNENENWLTKLTACMYWFSFFQERASQSHFGSMMCCSGAISLYKKDIILKYSSMYLNQKFLGLQCNAGDDRHLTNLFLLSGHKVGWSSKAVAHTPSPPETGKFLNQQLRWIRSHVASFWFLFSNLHRWSFIFGFLTFKLMYRYVYMALVYVGMFYLAIQEWTIVPFIVVLISILAVTAVKSVVAIFYTGSAKFLHMFMFSLYTFLLFNPIMFYGILTPHRVGWYTRDKYNSECNMPL